MYAEAERRGINSAWNGVKERKRKFILGRAQSVRSEEGGIWDRSPTTTKSTEVHTGLEWAVLGETVSSILCLLSLRCR